MKSYRDPTWGPATKLAALLCLVLVAWFVTPSSIFLKQLNMTIIRDTEGRWIAISERLTPYGAISVRTLAEIQVLAREDGQTCSAELKGLVTVKPNNVSRYDISNWAGPCLDAGPPTGVNFTRSVLLGGVLPLRPIYYSFTLNPDAAPVVDAGDL